MNKLLLMGLPIMALWFVVLLLPSEAGSSLTVPRPPVNVTVESGNGRALISWDVPPDAASTLPGDGGSDITGYKIQSSPGSMEVTSSTNNVTFTGLTNGVAYTFTVRATNSIGDSDLSQPSSSVTPATVPSEPRDVMALSKDSSAYLEWSAPSSNGGKALTGYSIYVGIVPEVGVEATDWKNDLTKTVGLSTSTTVDGLTNNTVYIFAVRATNGEGHSEKSDESNVIIPHSLHEHNVGPELTTTLSTGLMTNLATTTLSINIKDGDFRRLTVTHDREGTNKTLSLLTAYYVDEYADHSDSKISYTGSSTCGWSLKCADVTVDVALVEGLNTVTLSAEDYSGAKTTATYGIIGDYTKPSGEILIKPVLSSGEAVIGDHYFLVASIADTNSYSTTASGIDSVTEVSTSKQMNPVNQFSDLVIQTFALSKIGSKNTTHINYSKVESGLPVGTNTFQVIVRDLAGNETTLTSAISIKSARSNRNFFLFPGNNYVGLGLIPDDGNFWTADDASIDRLMRYDISSSVSTGFKEHIIDNGGTLVTLADVVDSTWAYSVGGTFLVHSTKGSAKNTLTKLHPHQGMIMSALGEYQDGTVTKSIFKQATYPGSQAATDVPIVFNIKGLFVQPGEIPPGKTLRVGYNLLAPHAMGKSLFQEVMRGALIPTPLTTHASTIVNSFEMASTSNSTVNSTVTRNDSQFVYEGGYLDPIMSYWVYVFDDPSNNSTNMFGDQLGPTITP